MGLEHRHRHLHNSSLVHSNAIGIVNTFSKAAYRYLDCVGINSSLCTSQFALEKKQVFTVFCPISSPVIKLLQGVMK